MRKRSTLITPPLDWPTIYAPAPPPVIPVLAERGGTQIKAPLAVLVSDSREQQPFNFSRFADWFSGLERRALKLGDYSIAGLEHVCVVERKSLSDLAQSCSTERRVFVRRLQRMARYPHRLLVVTAGVTEIKSRNSQVWTDPNRILQSLLAILVGLNVPFICTDTHELGEEIVASYLYQVHLYHWLENNEYGRYLSDGDL